MCWFCGDIKPLGWRKSEVVSLMVCLYSHANQKHASNKFLFYGVLSLLKDKAVKEAEETSELKKRLKEQKKEMDEQSKVGSFRSFIITHEIYSKATAKNI